MFPSSRGPRFEDLLGLVLFLDSLKTGKFIKVYVNNLVGDVKANPKDFYQYISSQKKDAQGIAPLKKRNGSGVAQSESEKAAESNGQFTDVFTKSEYSQVPLLDRSAPLSWKILLLLRKELHVLNF